MRDCCRVHVRMRLINIACAISLSERLSEFVNQGIGTKPITVRRLYWNQDLLSDAST